MTTSERWLWHTETYAWRIVHGYGSFDDLAVGKYSPTDPTGEWWDENAVRLKVKLMTADRERRTSAEQQSADELAAKGCEICDAWAVKHGYLDFAAAQHAGKGYGDVVKSFEMARERRQERLKRRLGRGPLYGQERAGYDLSAPIPEGQAEYLSSLLPKKS